jgi:hypothetical protein
MLLTNIYGLNKSQTKYISVGLSYVSADIFKTCVRIGKSSGASINFTAENWKLLQNFIKDVDDFFSGEKSGVQFQFVSDEYHTCVMSRHQFGKKMLCLRQFRRHSTFPKLPACIFLRDITWNGIKNISKLVNLNVEALQDLESRVRDEIENLCRYIFSKGGYTMDEAFAIMDDIDEDERDPIVLELCALNKLNVWNFAQKLIQEDSAVEPDN